MKMDEYQKLAFLTAKPMTLQGNLLHASLGLAGEVGEFVDSVKREFVYGQKLNVENLEEELGDILWFVALAATAIGKSLDQIAADNINKLSERYPLLYSDHYAAERLDKKGAA